MNVAKIGLLHLLSYDIRKENVVINNDAQNEAITNVNGPVLIIAGPGTGKTYTLVQRTIHLISLSSTNKKC